MEQFQTLLSHQNFVHPNKTALPTEKKTELDKKKNRTAILTKENRNAIPTKKNGCSCFLRYPSNSAAHTKKSTGQGATPNTSLAPKICPSQQNCVTTKKNEQNYDTHKTAIPTKTVIPTKKRYRQKRTEV
jgi:hypothetical protein